MSRVRVPGVSGVVLAGGCAVIPVELLALHAECMASAILAGDPWPPEGMDDLMRDLAEVSLAVGRPVVDVAEHAAGLMEAEGHHRAAMTIRVAAVEMMVGHVILPSGRSS